MPILKEYKGYLSQDRGRGMERKLAFHKLKEAISALGLRGIRPHRRVSPVIIAGNEAGDFYCSFSLIVPCL